MQHRYRTVSIAVGTLSALAGSVFLASASPAVARDHARVDALAWFAGCWTRTTARSIVEEQWMRPAGGLMLGVSRTLRRTAAGDSATEFEFVRVSERAGKLVYTAQPSGQAVAEFTSESVSDTSVIFANPAHDFPQRIIYRRRGADSLLARIEGMRNGMMRGVDFPYARSACPGSSR